MQQAWDYLIILDACRCDYFQQVWQKYLDRGELSCQSSVGSCTVEWRDKSFTQRYDDVVYISANPYINSLKPVLGFFGRDHFYKIYDLWQTGWVETLGTVPPQTVTQAALEIIPRHHDKRVIIHYLQPHAPYLTYGSESPGFPTPDLNAPEVLSGINLKQPESKIKLRCVKLLTSLCQKMKLLGDNPEWYLREFLHMAPMSPMDAARRKYGLEGLRNAYRTNLELALTQVAILIKYLAGRIVITADHGEHLGENNCFTHIPGSSSPYLRRIPWLVIEKQKENGLQPPLRYSKIEKNDSSASLDKEPDKNDAENIEKKLKTLGYM